MDVILSEAKDLNRLQRIEPMAPYCVPPEDSSLRADETRPPSAQNDKLFFHARFVARGENRKDALGYGEEGFKR